MLHHVTPLSHGSPLKSRRDFRECRRSGRGNSNLWNRACKCSPAWIRLEARERALFWCINVKRGLINTCGLWLLSNLLEVEVAAAFLQMTKWASAVNMFQQPWALVQVPVQKGVEESETTRNRGEMFLFLQPSSNKALATQGAMIKRHKSSNDIKHILKVS